MEQRIVLASILAMMFNDHKLGNIQEHRNTILDTLDNIHISAMMSEEDPRQACSGLKQLIMKLIKEEIEFDIKSIKQHVDIYCSVDPSFQAILTEVIQDTESDEKKLRNSISANLSSIHNYNKDYEVRKAINNISFKMNNENLTATDAMVEMRTAINKFDVGKTVGNELPGFMGRVDIQDRDGIREIMLETKKQLGGAVLHTGWKGVNRMLGVNNGIVPGECAVMPALPHNGKTTFTFSMLLSFAIFNDPKQFIVDKWENKKPLLLDISLENELTVNVPLGYKMVREHYENVAVDVTKIDVEEASTYLKDKLGERGWHIHFERYDSSSFTIETLRELVSRKEAEGFRIVAMRVDYLGVSNKTGLSNGTNGSEVREMYRRARNICVPRKIALISPHQLSPRAKDMAAMNPDGYVKDLPGKGFYDGCTTVDNEVDLEIFFGIVRKGDRSYLVLQRGKHRTIIETPQSHRSGVMRFADVGTLPWDFDNEKMNWLKSVNSDSMDSEEDLFTGFGMAA